MARGVNKVILIGTLGRDPESRYMPNGNAVCNLSLATDESYNDKNTGQRVDRTEWHRVVAFGRLAEIMTQYLKKGSKAYIEGKLQTREWEKDGIKRYSTEIIANDMTMLDSRNASASGMEEQSYGMGAMNQPMPQTVAPNTQAFSGMPQQANVQPQIGMQPQSGMQPQQTAPAQAGGYGQAPQQASQNAHFAASQQQPQQSNAHSPQPAPAGVPNFDDFDDDIPF